jgi:ABC-type antimicrobial peptide transport system permease subunit
MWYNLKHAYRNLSRNGLYSVINITGLAVSLAACILIMLWVWDELSFDRFHKNSDRLYRVNVHLGGMDYPVSPPPLANAVVQELPSVENGCCMSFPAPIFLEYEKEKMNLAAADVDNQFFTLFNFKLLKGSVENLSPDATVISKTVALNLFGDKDPVGEMVKASNGKSYQVAAVMEDMPGNSTLQMSALFFPDRKNDNNWGFSHQTYLLLRPGSDPGSVGEEIKALFIKNVPEMAYIPDLNMYLENIRKHHLYMLDGTDRGMQTVQLFIIIGILILVIAGINYVNLITARATRRSREMGLRKVVGASKINLFGQMLGEAVLLFLIATVLGLAIVIFVLPYYNTLTAKTFDLVAFLPQIALTSAGIFLAVIVLAGIYPAVMLASFRPAEAFKTKSGGSKNVYFRKVLVVVQFVFSAGLIMGAFVMNRQLNYIQKKNPGYDRENVAIIPTQKMNLNQVRDELLHLPGIAGVSGADEEICNVLNASHLSWEGKANPAEIFMVTVLTVEKHFISTMGIELIAGSDFAETEANEGSFIINETAARQMGFDDPIGKRLELGLQGTITGMVKDFHTKDMHSKIEPVFMFTKPISESPQRLYARIEAGKTKIALENLEKVWQRYNNEYQFTYTFLDQAFEKIHRTDLRTGMLFNLFAVIAIIISCLGLFGLVTYTAETKTKEIGIRKVLGATIANVVLMISKDFLLLVGIAMLIAFPLAYWILNGMLQDFAYRVGISWWMFAVAALIVIVLTLCTVGFKAVKTAAANPVRAIMSSD